MKAYYWAQHHKDIGVAVFILICGAVISLLQRFDAANLFGSVPMALLMGMVLAASITSPYFLYLVGKYLVRGYHSLSPRS